MREWHFFQDWCAIQSKKDQRKRLLIDNAVIAHADYRDVRLSFESRVIASI